jgi:replicative DNA helicase
MSGFRHPIGAGDFIFSDEGLAATDVLWGSSDSPLWTRGESLVVVGRDGVGKSTLAQRLALARAGFGEPALLGLPVAVSERPTLYCASDRPAQVRRSLRRMVTEEDCELLDARLRISVGFPDFDICEQPEALVEIAAAEGAGTVVIDSVKDFVSDVSRDDVGHAVNKMSQALLSNDIEVVLLHHERKDRKGRSPSIADVHGSRWITAGAGSIIALDGVPGGRSLTLRHLKQPSGPVGPLALRHHPLQGRLVRADQPEDLQASPPIRAVTVRDFALQQYGDSEPASVERARRSLNAWLDAGVLRREGTSVVTYLPVGIDRS